MKKSYRPKTLAQALVTIGIVAGTFCGLTAFLCTAEPNPGSTNAPPKKKIEVRAEKKKAKKLSGSELYSINCNRCHAERYPTEFNSTHWKTVLTHMRVRANIPAAQAKEILKYLQEESSN